MVASAAWLPDDDPEAEPAGLRAADRAAAAGLPGRRVGRPRPGVRQPPPALGVRRRARGGDGPREGHGPAPVGRDDGVRVQRLPAHGLRGVARRRRPARGGEVRRPPGRAALLPRLRPPRPGPAARGRRPRGRPHRRGPARANGSARPGNRPAGTRRPRSPSGLRAGARPRPAGRRHRARGMARDRPRSWSPARFTTLDGVETGWAPTLDAWLLLDRAGPTRRGRSSRSTWTTPSGPPGAPPSGDRGTPRPGPRPARSTQRPTWRSG